MEHQIKLFKATGDISENLYSHTNRLIKSALFRKYSLIVRTEEAREDVVQLTWIKIITNIKDYDHTFAWSTYVYNSVQYAMNRDYPVTCNTITIPQEPYHILSKYKKMVGSGTLCHDEFVTNAMNGEYSKAYRSKAAIERIISSVRLQPDVGKKKLEGKEIDVFAKCELDDCSPEVVLIHNVLRDNAREYLRGMFKKQRAAVLEHRVLPLLFNDHGVVIEYKALSNKLGIATSTIVRNYQRIIDDIKNDEKAVGLLKEYIEYRRAM